MAGRKNGLGRGLDALFPEKTPVSRENVRKPVTKPTKKTEISVKADQKNESSNQKKTAMMVKISNVEPNRNQPRKQFDEDALLELSESVKQYGILQPLLVSDKKDYYEIIAGERRWRAAKLAGLKEVPVIVKEFSAQELVEISLIENIQREDLNPYEKALGIRNLMDKYGLTQEEVSKRIGKSRSAVSNTVRILNLAPDVLELVKEGKLSEGHCKALAAITDQKRQYEMAIRMIERGESVRQAEQKNLRAKKEKYLDPKYKMLYDDIEDRFQGFFGTKVKLDQGKRKGKIIIEYNGNSDLERILDLLK